MKILSWLNITFKNTFPIYAMISLLTFIFLTIGSYFNGFSNFGQGFLANIWFSLSYNLLFFIPQTLAILISLRYLHKKKTKMFFRLSPSISIISTFLMILFFKYINFFSRDADLKNLYINLLIILTMNIIFATIISLNIYSKVKKKFHIIDPNSKKRDENLEEKELTS
jgi:hypothetical protein